MKVFIRTLAAALTFAVTGDLTGAVMMGLHNDFKGFQLWSPLVARCGLVTASIVWPLTRAWRNVWGGEVVGLLIGLSSPAVFFLVMVGVSGAVARMPESLLAAPFFLFLSWIMIGWITGPVGAVIGAAVASLQSRDRDSRHVEGGPLARRTESHRTRITHLSEELIMVTWKSITYPRITRTNRNETRELNSGGVVRQPFIGTRNAIPRSVWPSRLTDRSTIMRFCIAVPAWRQPCAVVFDTF